LRDDGQMEIRELRAFIAVMEEGTFSAAARRLHISQPSLSASMQSLERQLGGKLFLRHPSGTEPTEIGEALLSEARALVARHDRIVSTLAVPSASPGTTLRVGVPLELPPDLLPAAMARLSAIHPELTLQLQHARSTTQVTALKAGELDAALVRDRPADPDIDSALAVEEPMGVILTTARSEELAEPSGVRLHRLSGLRWIGFARGDAPKWHDHVSATLRNNGVAGVDPAAEQDRPVPPEVKLAAAGTGQAFALAAPGWARPLPDGLVWQPLVGNPLVRRTWVIWPADARGRELASLVDALDLAAR
jgi:DNA-binding transcriptional LysR family regulator